MLVLKRHMQGVDSFLVPEWDEHLRFSQSFFSGQGEDQEFWLNRTHLLLPLEGLFSHGGVWSFMLRVSLFHLPPLPPCNCALGYAAPPLYMMKVIKIWWKWKKGWGKAHALYERIIFRHNWCFLFTSSGTPLQYSCLENPMDGGAWWATVRGVAGSRTRLSDFTFTFHFHALEKEMATHSSVLALRIPGMGEPGGLPSMGSRRVGHDWSDLAVAAAFTSSVYISKYQYNWVWRLWLSQLHVWIYLVWRCQGCCWTSYNAQYSPPQQRITHLKISIVPRLRNTAIFSSPNSQRPFSIIVLSALSWKSLKVFLLILG